MTNKSIKNLLTELVEEQKSIKFLEGYVAETILDDLDSYSGDTKARVKSWFNDLMRGGCSSGFVSSLLYYTDTHNFFDTYSDEILTIYANLQEELGQPIEIKGDPKNFLSWFGFEESARTLAYKLGIEL